MPLYIPWLTETIKKRGVRYLLHHYLGQFFEEKLTLEQLSIDIYEGKGSIRNLALDVDGLNDELDFIPFTFLEGCLIGQISVEVPWSSLVTDACRVELDGAKFFCRLKTTADAAKHHCIESTLLSRSLMTSSMQMAEEIVTTEDDDDIESIHQQHQHQQHNQQIPCSSKHDAAGAKKKDANQMFEGLEMFAQLIDSVLRRTKLTAHNTLFQIQPHNEKESDDEEDEEHEPLSDIQDGLQTNQALSRSSGDEFSEPAAKSDTDDESNQSFKSDKNQSKSTVEFFIKFFRCEEMIDQTQAEGDSGSSPSSKSDDENDGTNKSLRAIPETITKLLTLEDVEMRIDGVPVSNLIGKHTITIKFNGQKSEISIFSGSPLLAVISHKQLETFFNVFDGSSGQDLGASFIAEKNQKFMSSEDYAKIENQLLESASLRNIVPSDLRAGSSVGGGGGGFGGIGGSNILNNKCPYYTTAPLGFSSSRSKWGPECSSGGSRTYAESHTTKESEYGYHSPQGSEHSKIPSESVEHTLNHIEAFSCELKLPGIWLCILRAGEALPPLIKPYADSINSFQTINKYIDNHIKVPHIRCLALKVALDITALGTNVFLGDLDISEHLGDCSRMSPVLKLLNNDQTNTPMSSSRYKASISNGKDVIVDLLAKTRVMFDPTIIDRIVYDYNLVRISPHGQSSSSRKSHTTTQSSSKRNHSADLNLTLRGDQFKVELLCPIPDLTPDAHKRRTQLRPQSFIFDFKETIVTWQSDKLTVISCELLAYVKTQPMQSDGEAVKFIEATARGNDKITLILEPSPSNLDNAFNSEVEQALNESSMYDSIYVSQATKSRLPKDPFQTKRKVVRASFQSQSTSNKPNSARISECDHEKILTPGDRQHLLDYLDQTIMATKLSLSLHLPVCEVEFEDKEQLDLIYNRFGNDFVFWHPKALNKQVSSASGSSKHPFDDIRFKQPCKLDNDDDEEDELNDEDRASNVSDLHPGSQNSLHSMRRNSVDASQLDHYENEVTCKVMVDELFVKFNHQSCAAALKQEIAAENFLLGVIIDMNKKPNTLLSMVADNLELSTDLDTVLQGNYFGDKNSIFALTAEIKRPTKLLKDIKLAIQLKNGLFNDFRSETYTRFWQSINVTDEPIIGYVAPQIVTELHIDILSTSLLLVREDARPALLSIDELYMTSMVMEKTSQVMIRLIADEVSLYMKRDRQGLETMKNYICLIDSGLIDVDVKFGQDERLEFGVINNVITVRVCQDSLNALCKLFNVLIRNSSQQQKSAAVVSAPVERTSESGLNADTNQTGQLAKVRVSKSVTKVGGKATPRTNRRGKRPSATLVPSHVPSGCNQRGESKEARRQREMNLLADAMNDYSITSTTNGPKRRQTAGSSGEATFSAGGPRRPNNSSEEDELNDEDERRDYIEDKRRGIGQGDRSSDDDDEDNENYDDTSDEAERDYDDEEDEVNKSSRNSDSDSDSPPVFQQPASEGMRQRDPNACLLDESNPLLGDMFSQPLLPSSSSNETTPVLDTSAANQATLNLNETSRTGEQLSRAMDESGFFVIGDDDVGAGIIDKKQHEPLVRKLIDGPINIIENHFKMTKPRIIPEMLANSLQRYVLEEMTLVVNLFGGHDFDDEDTSTATNDDSAQGASNPVEQTAESRDELLDTVMAESQLVRSRAGSVAVARRPSALSDGSLKRRRRKHLSEGGSGNEMAPGKPSGDLTQRVRFGEGALNLWESLDLMSSPDFLGARPRPSQPTLNSDLKQAGGTWRENDVCIQLTLSKVKLLYELADGSGQVSAANKLPTNGAAGSRRQPEQEAAPTTPTGGESNLTPPISWRFMLFIQDIEVKDRIAASDINKMLYEYCTESMPKRSTQMLAIKSIATINPGDGCEECDLRVSLKPLRLNIDQDTLLFLIEFCTAFCKALTKQQQQQQQTQSSATMYPSGGADEHSPSRSLLVSGGGGDCASPVKPAKQVDGASGNAMPSGRFTTSAARQQQSAGLGVGSARARRETRPLDAKNNRPTATTIRSAQESQSSTTGSSRYQYGSGATSELHRDDVNNSRITITTPVTIITETRSKHADDGRNNDDGQHAHEPEDSEEEDYWESSEEMEATNESSGENDLDGHTLAAKTTTPSSASTTGTSTASEGGLPTHCHTDDLAGAAKQQPIYIKLFTFSPDVPIRIDYHAKHLDFEQGALAGILMGLAHLDHSELILRRVQAKHGMRGLDRVLLFAINSWLSDIKRNQLPSILGGVGPMHSVIQLFQGMRDLVWMPIDHYRKDGRLVRGLQRGASSFSSSTAMAAINLVNRFISIVQCTAQIAHDIVTPPNTLASHPTRRLKVSPAGGGAGLGGQSAGSSGVSAAGLASGRRNRRRRHTTHQEGRAIGGSHSLVAGAAGSSGAGGLNQPRNFCEGVAVGFNILKEGFNDTARNVTVGMQAEDMRSAVGELVRQIPSTLLNPIISATEGAQSVLVGIRNQIAPDARREDQEKWKGRVRGK